MKRLINVTLSVILMLCVISSLGIFTASAASSSAIIAFSSSSVSVGDTFTVTAKFSSSTNIGAIDARIYYDESVVEYVSLKSCTSSGGSLSGGGGALKLSVYDSGKPSSITFVITFKGKKAGSSAIRIGDSVAYDYDEKLIGNPGASATMTVKDTTQNLSSNANLSSLKISNVTLSPSFSANTVSYTVNVENSVTSLTISANVADSGAKVSISGSNSLSVGTNTRVVTVTAADGTQKSYTIKITRAAAASTSSASSQPATSQAVTSSENVSSAAPANPLEVYVDSNLSLVAKSFAAAAIPQGFHMIEYIFNGVTVPAVTDQNEKITLLYLTDKDGENGKFFIYNNSDISFSPFINIVVASDSYTLIDLPSGVTLPSGFISVSHTFGDQVTKVWKSFENSEMNDFLLVYAINPKGEQGFYLYDTVEATIQRYINPVATEKLASGPVGDDTGGLWQTIGYISMPLCVIFLALAIVFFILYRKNRVYFLK